jgi:hypothetical protein
MGNSPGMSDIKRSEGEYSWVDPQREWNIWAGGKRMKDF